jgi:hypothetical protein
MKYNIARYPLNFDKTVNHELSKLYNEFGIIVLSETLLITYFSINAIG